MSWQGPGIKSATQVPTLDRKSNPWSFIVQVNTLITWHIGQVRNVALDVFIQPLWGCKGEGARRWEDHLFLLPWRWKASTRDPVQICTPTHHSLPESLHQSIQGVKHCREWSNMTMPWKLEHGARWGSECYRMMYLGNNSPFLPDNIDSVYVWMSIHLR